MMKRTIFFTILPIAFCTLYRCTNATNDTGKINEESSNQSIINIDSITSSESTYTIQYRNKVTRFFEDRNYIIYSDRIIMCKTKKDTIICDSLIFDSRDSLISIPGKFKIKNGSMALEGEGWLWNINKNSFKIKKVKGTMTLELYGKK